MKVLIEGEKYSLQLLQQIFDDPKFYHEDLDKGTILSVGYYHSYFNDDLVYMLPKVFMRDAENTVFGISKDELFDLKKSETFKHKDEYNWIRKTSVYFYNSLLEFRRRHNKSTIVQTSLIATLNTNINKKEYSYLDLFLSFINFYKKNKNTILYKYIESKTNQIRKTNWSKTVRKSNPIIGQDKQFIYETYRNKRKVQNSDEELFIYFFSILNHFNHEHNLFMQIDKSYKIITGSKFRLLQKNGLTKLRKIKYRYFSDTLKKMYHLCEIYFSQTDTSSVRRKKSEFISVNNYNLIFEDMIDKLFSDPLQEIKTNDGVSLNKLKYNDDGKIVDHLFDYQSLLDTSDIFYIGDSKYYKSTSNAGKLSKYKQFTYAKNVIQYNIDLLNEKNIYYSENIRYRDELTEGYNITPNFFVYGYINDYRDFEQNSLQERGEIVSSYHFKGRLFDRDSLFVHQYEINFLYVLKSYTQFNNNYLENFRINTKKIFRENFINFFSDSSKCGFNLFKYKLENYDEFVEKNFRIINGKCYKTSNNELILAQYHDDTELLKLITDFEPLIIH